jgi:hypothetical protein
MAEYSSRLDAAEIPGRLERIRDEINKLEPSQRQDIATQHPDVLERIEVVLDYAATILDDTQSELVPQNSITSLTSHLDQLHSYMQSLQTATSYARNADGVADSILSVLAGWPTRPRARLNQEISRAATKYRRSLGRQIGELRGNLRELDAEREAARKEVERLATDFDSRAQAAQQELEKRIAVLDGRLADMTSTLDAHRARLEELSAAHQKQFSDAQEQRGKDFDATLSVWRAGFSEIETEARVSIAEILEELTKHEREAQRVVGYIATTGTAGAYADEAATQARVANGLRSGAIVVAAIASAIVIWAVFHGLDTSGPSWLSVSKGLAAVALYGIAGYLASQSGRHRRREEFAKGRELDLVAFGPFVAELDDADRKEARAKLADRIFGHDRELDAEEARLTEDNISLVGRVLDLFAKSQK